MADKTYRTNFDVTATDRATQVFKSVKGSADDLSKSYLALAGAATAALSAGGIAAFFSDAVRYRASLQELAETTGDNVTTLDALARQARISGLEFDRLEGSLAKFARNLNAADDEGNAAAQALGALGLNVEELRAMKPADAMLEVAKALGHFEDGASKVAVAVALMGKEGAKQLPFLKDLAENQDALGRLTADQVEHAKQLEQEWRKLKIAFEDGKSTLADALIPKVGELLEQMREGIKIAGGFGAALRLFGLNMSPGGDVGASLAERQKALADWQSAGGFGRFMQKPFGSSYAGTEDDLRKQIEFLKFLQRQQALAGRTGGEFLDARDLAARQKDTLDFVPKKLGAEQLPSLWTPQDEEMFQARKKAWEESEKIDAEEAKLLAELVAAGEKYNTTLEARAEGYRDLIDPGRKYLQDQKKVQELVDAGKITDAEAVAIQRKLLENRTKVEDLGKSADIAAESTRAIGLSFTSAMDQMVFNSDRGIHALDLLRAAALDVAKIIFARGVSEPTANFIQSGLAGLLSGGSGIGTGMTPETVDFLPFAEGGVMTSRGRVPLRRYDGGGIADSPQLAMFGEGSMNEAYVPLPDGKRIPVQMSGQSGHTFVIDARGADRSGLARLEAMIRRIDGSVEYRAVASVRRAAALRGRSTAY